MDEIGYLADVSIFSHMKRKDLKRVAKLATPMSCKAGDVIVREGERDGRLYVILNGQAEVIKGLGGPTEWRLRALGPRSYFGEMAIIDDLPRSASVVSKGGVTVLVLNKLDLLEEIKKYPVLALELLQMLSRRIRAIEKCVINAIGAFLPVCVHCKRIWENDYTWTPIDKYLADHSDAEVSHRICPDCSQRLYPQFYVEKKS